MKTKTCPHCKATISSSNFNRHIAKCDGSGTWIMRESFRKERVKNTVYSCDICAKIFGTAQALTGHRQRSHEKRNLQSAYGKLGAGLGGFDSGEFTHSEETKEKLSIIACERLKKHSKYSKNVEYKPGVILESSYELETAKILDELNIAWVKVRKGYIWDDNGRTRRYVPDFYLPEYDIFLDPKNDYLIKKDLKKIESAMKLNNIKVIILSKDQITKEHILVSTGCRRDL